MAKPIEQAGGAGNPMSAWILGVCNDSRDGLSSKKGCGRGMTKMMVTVLTAAIAVVALGGLSGCDGGFLDIEATRSPAIIEIVEGIGVSDSSQVSPPKAITVTEHIGVDDVTTVQPMLGQIVPPATGIAVRVTAPRAGEVWLVGSAREIRWTTTGEGIDYVDIHYSIDGGRTLTPIARREPDDGVFAWKVSDATSRAVMVRVTACNVGGKVLASGDSGLFAIAVRQ